MNIIDCNRFVHGHSLSLPTNKYRQKMLFRNYYKPHFLSLAIAFVLVTRSSAILVDRTVLYYCKPSCYNCIRSGLETVHAASSAGAASGHKDANKKPGPTKRFDPIAISVWKIQAHHHAPSANERRSCFALLE